MSALAENMIVQLAIDLGELAARMAKLEREFAKQTGSEIAEPVAPRIETPQAEHGANVIRFPGRQQ